MTSKPSVRAVSLPSPSMSQVNSSVSLAIAEGTKISGAISASSRVYSIFLTNSV